MLKKIIVYIATCAMGVIAVNAPLAASNSIGSTVNVNVLGSANISFGGFLKDESDNNEASVTYSDGVTKTDSANHNSYSFGMHLDILPFSPFVSEAGDSAFNIAFRVKYSKSKMEQSLEIGDDKEYEKFDWDATLLKSQVLLGGIALYYAPEFTPGENNEGSSAFVITVFAMAGTYLKGDLTPYPIYQKELLGTSASTDFSGYKIEAGLGCELSGETMFHVGGNIYYGYSGIKTKQAVYSADEKNLNFSEVTFELYAGITI